MFTAKEATRTAECLDARCGLNALFLFGSQASGREHAGSDVDLAALVRRVPPPMERIEIREELSSRLARPVDLVFLNDASPILARQVLQHGRLLADRDPRRRGEFAARVLTEYADLKRAREPAERKLVERMRCGMPANGDLVFAKVAAIDRCLRRIQDVTGGETGTPDDQDTEDIFDLNLQRAVQAAIDLANHLVAEEDLELPATLREAFDHLESGADLSSDLASRMRAMVGFRNVAFHDYQALDKTVLKAILEQHLGDLRAFAHYALNRCGPA